MAEFVAVRGDFAGRFRGYLAFKQFRYSDPTSGNPVLDLSNDPNLADFLGLLIDRHNRILDMLYVNDPNGARARRAISLVGSQVLTSQRTGTKFDKDDFMAVRNLYVPAQPNSPLWEVNHKYQLLFNEVYLDPGMLVQFQMGILSFYDSVRFVESSVESCIA
jgi:hypothetical protein